MGSEGGQSPGLSAKQVADYQSTGFLCPLRLLTAEEAAAALSGLNRYRTRLGGVIEGPWRFKAHLLLPWMADLVRHPALVAVVRSALRTEDILCWSTDIFIKEPAGTRNQSDNTPKAGYTGWHQDSTYVAFDPPDVLTLWLALTPSTPENGCLRFLPGSHQAGQLDHVERPGEGSMLLKGQEVAVGAPEGEGIEGRLQPGEASLHHVKLVHRSGANTSHSSRRVGVAIRYMSSSVRQGLAVRDSVTLVSGQPPSEYYRLEPRPSGELEAAGLAAHRAAVGAVYPEGMEPPGNGLAADASPLVDE